MLENKPFVIALRRNAKKWTFLKIDPYMNLDYIYNPPPMNFDEFGVPALLTHCLEQNSLSIRMSYYSK